ncbi:hypothetical protein VKT23_019614 [Stygiomarasmius scandens]|uniref:Uncharacterized protein n=1 Tax=Marasmiellus scandens TaxID=2682957 RepID=A0ABR1IQ94_9AGAR
MIPSLLNVSALTPLHELTLPISLPLPILYSTTIRRRICKILFSQSFSESTCIRKRPPSPAEPDLETVDAPRRKELAGGWRHLQLQLQGRNGDPGWVQDHWREAEN